MAGARSRACSVHLQTNVGQCRRNVGECRKGCRDGEAEDLEQALVSLPRRRMPCLWARQVVQGADLRQEAGRSPAALPAVGRLLHLRRMPAVSKRKPPRADECGAPLDCPRCGAEAGVLPYDWSGRPKLMVCFSHDPPQDFCEACESESGHEACGPLRQTPLARQITRTW